MAIFKTNPKKLDEKLGIVRDRLGNVVSRNGVPEPYYISPEERDKEEEYYQSIKHDENKVQEFFNKIAYDEYQKIIEEDRQNHALAKQKIAEISLNPTKNFYEDYITDEPVL